MKLCRKKRRISMFPIENVTVKKKKKPLLWLLFLTGTTAEQMEAPSPSPRSVPRHLVPVGAAGAGLAVLIPTALPARGHVSGPWTQTQLLPSASAPSPTLWRAGLCEEGTQRLVPAPLGTRTPASGTRAGGSSVGVQHEKGSECRGTGAARLSQGFLGFAQRLRNV